MVCLQALSLFVLIISGWKQTLWSLSSTSVFHHWSRSPSFKFSAVWPACVSLRLFRARFTNVNVNQKGVLWTCLLHLEFGLLWICHTLITFNWQLLVSYTESYPQALTITITSYTHKAPPHTPAPRCLEHDDSKNSKIDLFRSTGRARSMTTRTRICKGWRLCSSYRALSWVLYAFLFCLT